MLIKALILENKNIEIIPWFYAIFYIFRQCFQAFHREAYVIEHSETKWTNEPDVITLTVKPFWNISLKD